MNLSFPNLDESSLKQITILAVDTATESCSAALWHQGELSALNTQAPRAHTEKILPMVDRLLADAGISIKQVDAIAFGQGPGSFTGIRVGVSVAQGLGFGANKPLIPISNLMALAQGAKRVHNAKNVIAAIDARMSEIYVASMYYCDESHSWQYITSELVLSPESWLVEFEALVNTSDFKFKSSQFTPAGTGFETYPHLLSSPILSNHVDSITDIKPLFSLPLAEDMIPIAINKFLNKQTIDALEAEPTYLRNEVTWQKLPGR